MEHDPTLLGLGATGWVAVAFVIFVIAAIKPIISKVGGMLDEKSAAIGAQLKEAKQHLTETLKRREEQAAEKIARAEAQALQDVRNQAVELAMAATGSLLADKMTAEVNDKIVKSAVADLPARLQ